MLRSLCVVVLLPSLTVAQTRTDSVHAGSQSPRGETAVEPPTYRQYTYYRQIRRGTTEKAAIVLVVGDNFVTSPRAPIPGIMPLKLELEDKDGITIERIKYPEVIKHTVKFQREKIKGTWDPTIKLNIHAEKNAALGEHILKGRLTFQVVSATGISPTQKLDVSISLNVVGRHAKVEKIWQIHETPRWKIALIVVLAPVAFVLVVPMSLACNLGVESACF